MHRLTVRTARSAASSVELRSTAHRPSWVRQHSTDLQLSRPCPRRIDTAGRPVSALEITAPPLEQRAMRER